MPARAAPDNPQGILDFWIDDVGPAGWYGGGPDLDARIRTRFEPLWKAALDGKLDSWLTNAGGCLAFLILTDQFPRNMYREDARAFASDKLALGAASMAIHRRWDLRVPEPERQFFYLPLMHSETPADQDRCVRLILTRLPETGTDNLLHARAHRAVIRRFGRFPYRNAALGRVSRPEEIAYLESGGYGNTVAEMKAA